MEKITLSADIEQAVNQQILSGNYPTVADVIRSAVLLLAQRDHISQPAPPRRSPRGILADIYQDINREDIDEVRREMWANFPRDDV